MNIIFIGGFFPKEYINQIRKNSIGPLANANNALQWAYIEGLKHNLNSTNGLFQLITLPQIGGYPFRYKTPFFYVKEKEFGKEESLQGLCLNFFNLKAIKRISHYWVIKKTLIKYLSKHKWNEYILLIVYDLQIPVLKAIGSLKKQFPNLRCCLIVPDLHGLTGGKRDMIHRVFEYIENKQLLASYKSVDSFVLISKHMKERLPVNAKPWIVIEGIYNVKENQVTNNIKSDKLKKIFYSGALDKRNGVHNLLEAFSLISDPSYRLFLCGDGDLRVLIETKAKSDSRIIYWGQLSRNEVLKLQQESTLLVNPRLSGAEFTRYSFPSKTMEYFGSGIPVLMYRLEGIPEEYYNYCFTPKNDSVNELKESILQIINRPQEELFLFGKKAQEFVMMQKNTIVQTSKLLKMISDSFGL